MLIYLHDVSRVSKCCSLETGVPKPCRNLLSFRKEECKGLRVFGEGFLENGALDLVLEGQEQFGAKGRFLYAFLRE